MLKFKVLNFTSRNLALQFGPPLIHPPDSAPSASPPPTPPPCETMCI